jgi:uncharacterized protein
MEYLVIDGYNVINAWRDLFDLEGDSLEVCREKFLHLLSNFQGYRKNNIIVVFDAHQVKNSPEKQEMFDHITVAFTKENITADNYIERFVYRLAATHTIRVVTSDYLEQTLVMSKGGVRVSPRELRAELDATVRKPKPPSTRNPGKSNSIMSRLSPDLVKKLEEIRRGED